MAATSVFRIFVQETYSCLSLLFLLQDPLWHIASLPQTQRPHSKGTLKSPSSIPSEPTDMIDKPFIQSQDRFVRLATKSHIPSRQSAVYSKAIRQRHAAILGICALIDSFPYTVEKWMPALLTNVLAEHTYDPVSSFAHLQCFSPPLLIPSDDRPLGVDYGYMLNRSLYPLPCVNVRVISRERIKTLGTKTRNGLPSNN